MTTETVAPPTARKPELLEQTVMTNTALTGATYDIDGGQQVVGH